MGANAAGRAHGALLQGQALPLSPSSSPVCSFGPEKIMAAATPMTISMTTRKVMAATMGSPD